MIDITFKRHAKVIIVGEHAVVRGYPGIVVPHQHLNITCRYQSHLPHERIGNCHKTQWVLDQHFDTIWKIVQIHFNQPRVPLKGTLTVENHIPIALGCGFSAAFSVVIAELGCHVYNMHPSDETIYHLAKKLEDHFHGKSSGIDIAGVIHSSPIYYRGQDEIEHIKMAFDGYFYLCHSNEVSPTKQCVNAVEKMHAPKIDEQMAIATGLVRSGLTLSGVDGILLVEEGIKMANECFKSWQLMTPQLDELSHTMSQMGAVATKVTGAGGGGLMLGLWEKPLKQLPKNWMPLSLETPKLAVQEMIA